MRAVQVRVRLDLFVFQGKVEFYQNVVDLSPPVPITGSPKAVHMLSCLCDNACKISLAIYNRIRASCPFNRLLFVPTCAEQAR